MSRPAGSSPPSPGRPTPISKAPSASPRSRPPAAAAPIWRPNTGASPPAADRRRRSSPWNTPCSSPSGTCSPPALPTPTSAATSTPATTPTRSRTGPSINFENSATPSPSARCRPPCPGESSRQRAANWHTLPGVPGHPGRRLDAPSAPESRSRRAHSRSICNGGPSTRDSPLSHAHSPIRKALHVSRTTRRVLVALSAVCMALFGLAVAPAASAAPSQALDTYKLQLPTATNGKGDEVSRDALVAGYSSTWFQPTADGRGYRFKVPVKGVPGAGTSFPRTELREVNPDGSLAGWAGGDGVTRTFRAVYKINHLPAGDRETTLFQIHNGDTEVTTIRVADTGSQMNVVVRKNGLSLSPKLITNCAYGTRLDLKVVVNTRVKVYLAGVLKFDFPFSDLTIGSGGKFYEKAGNYLQANTVTASAADYGEIEMRLPVGANHYLVRTGSPTRPAAPVLTAASSPADTTTTTNQVVLDWNNAAGATRYDIHEDLNTLDHVVATVPVSNATFGNPTPGQYEYYVVARNSAGASVRSNKMTCTVPGGP